MSEERDDQSKWISGFVTGLVVGLLLALGGGGAWMLFQVQGLRESAAMEAMRAREAEMVAREEAERARQMAEDAAARAREAAVKADREKEGVPAKTGTAKPPATKPSEKGKP